MLTQSLQIKKLPNIKPEQRQKVGMQYYTPERLVSTQSHVTAFRGIQTRV
jgi:hypothetical protein